MYKELNPKQRQAVFTNNNKVLVMAGAGSGKTKVLTTRIMYQLSTGVLQSDICAFTFTNKAAKSMKMKLELMLRDKDIDLPIISTFHSFCYSYISLGEFFPLLGFENKPVVIMESDKSKIIEDILKKYNSSYSTIPFVKNISRIKNGATLIDINNDDRILFNTVYHEYQETLKNSNSIDFDDMIPLFIKLCNEHPYIRELVQVKYLLIDECQDTNQIQYELIKVLSEKYGNVFMVGDEDQLIYSFRSSDITILKDYQINCDEIIILDQNYRCDKDILKFANKLIEYNSDRLKKHLYSNINTQKESVSFKEFSSTNEEALFVSNKICELINTGVDYKDIAILYRNNNQVYAIEKELNSMNIPYQLFGGKSFFEYKEIKNIIYTYRLLFNPRNEIAFSNIYNFNHKIEVYSYAKFIEDYRKQKLDIIQFAKTYSSNDQINKLGNELSLLHEVMQNESVSEFFMRVLKVLHYTRYLKESNQQKPQYERIMALMDMIKELSINDLEESFNQMILDNISSNLNNRVSLLTIHKAKGLEFDVVFVIGMNEGILPGYGSKGKILEEERRLCYVAMTRAKRLLYLYCSIIHFVNGNIAKLKPSSFLVEAGIKESNPMDFFGNYWYNH